MSGALYLIGTPIGNLGDVSPRVTETLRSLDLLYCEDTRMTAKLLQLIGVKLPLRALSDDHGQEHWDSAVQAALDGQRIGFVSDAGMPGVSDPARRLTRSAWQAGMAPQVIPGPSALSTLLSACPFVDNSFVFKGFAPRKPGERSRFVAELRDSPLPCFFFESPLRAHALLEELCAAVEPERLILVGREMTKLHEQYALFMAEQWAEERGRIPERGEYSLAVAARPQTERSAEAEAASAALVRLEASGFSRKDAAKALAAVWDIGLNEIKKLSYL
ncbi:16S rRNA (cytidine(1402)-2'-O)-methyltransferase [bacterium]|nr:16S rRNA (cytidine(1402)-2'-O)-methyltransferase [bacterium]